jgi:hypothetical protein
MDEGRVLLEAGRGTDSIAGGKPAPRRELLPACTDPRLREKMMDMEEPAPAAAGGHVVLCGLNELGYRTLEELVRLGEDVVAIVRSPGEELARGARDLGATLVVGNYRHGTDRYANNRVEADHGHLKARLHLMRGLKQDGSASVILAGHAFVQNVRRGYYELAVEEPVGRRLAVAFDMAI